MAVVERDPVALRLPLGSLGCGVVARPVRGHPPSRCRGAWFRRQRQECLAGATRETPQPGATPTAAARADVLPPRRILPLHAVTDAEAMPHQPEVAHDL